MTTLSATCRFILECSNDSFHGEGVEAMSKTENGASNDRSTHLLSLASHTVLKWPQPSFLMMTYLEGERLSIGGSGECAERHRRVSPAMAEFIANVDRMVASLHVVLVILFVFGHNASRTRRRRRGRRQLPACTLVQGFKPSDDWLYRDIPDGCANRYRRHSNLGLLWWGDSDTGSCRGRHL